MNALFAAGDVGGARALLPVAREMAKRGIDVSAVAHRNLLEEGDPAWTWLKADQTQSQLFDTRSPFDIMLYATSVADDLAVSLADAAITNAVPTIHMLDNWSNYYSRLLDSQGGLVVPDIYCVMDEQALKGAKDDNVPEGCLRVTGHPNLAHLGKERQKYGGAFSADGYSILFVSEPAAADSGQSRGYDEEQVSRIFAKNMMENADRPLEIHIAPHPRENRDVVDNRWQALLDTPNSGHNISWRIVPVESVRETLHRADLVVGMSSILLYEAWLLSKPVMSLQPGVTNPALRTLADRQGLVFCDNAENAASAVCRLLNIAKDGVSKSRPELAVHENAASEVINIAMQLVNNSKI